jgi:hypothetical protein
MSDGRWSPAIVQGWIDQVAAMPKWMALFFADPIAVNPSSVEILGPSYARIDSAWTRSSPYSLTLNEGTNFRALAPGTSVAAIGVMSGAFNNVLIARELVLPVRSYPSGGTFSLDAGEWVLGIQVPAG